MNISSKAKKQPPPYQKSLVERKKEVVKEYATLVKNIAGRFSLRLPPDIDIDDLIQVGMIGLLESVDRYDASKEANFKTYAEYRIRGSMLDELRARDWIPRSVRTNAAKLEKAFVRLRSKGVELATHQELADELEMTLDEFEEFLLRNVSISMISLDSMGNSYGDNSFKALDVIPDPKEVLIEDKLISKELNDKLAKAISKLPLRDQLILSLSYKDELNLKEISQILEITEARVCQIRTKLIGYLRSYLSK